MEQDKNNKMPKFSMSWIYMLVIIGLISVYLMGGDSIGGSASKKVSYDEFRAYVTKGYASEIVLNKDESTLKMYVKAEHIRDVFKAGTKEVGKTPFVTSEFGSADKVESFVDAERQAGKNAHPRPGKSLCPRTGTGRRQRKYQICPALQCSLHPHRFRQQRQAPALSQPAAHGHRHMLCSQRFCLRQLPCMAIVKGVVLCNDTGKFHR